MLTQKPTYPTGKTTTVAIPLDHAVKSVAVLIALQIAVFAALQFIGLEAGNVLR